MTTQNVNIKAFLAENTLNQKISIIEESIRSEPSQFQNRWQLFLILSLQGNWTRAIQQLQTCTKFNAEFAQQAQALRWLIKCEHLREDIFTHATKKPPIFGENFDWMTQMFSALSLNIKNDVEQADQIRGLALDQAPECTGTINGQPFAWLTDSDLRLGPICELYHNQNYWWMSYSEIKQIDVHTPQTVLDLIWTKAEFTLKDQSTFMAYMPARYPLTEKQQDDNVLLSQYTYWEEEGDTLVKGYGQKVLTTDLDDFPLLECTKIEFA